MGPTDYLFNLVSRIARRFGIEPLASIEGFATEAASVPAEERNRSDLHRAFYDNQGPIVHKWRHYLAIYDRHLSRYRGSACRLLEIGVYKGGSLHLWRRYLGASATIFGIDIDPACASLNDKDAVVRIGSQSDEGFLRSVVREMGGVDIVIDDGSHRAFDQVTSFQTLFPLLDANGVYLCEDLHSSYWRGSFGGGRRRRGTFVETMKLLVDDLHQDFHRDITNMHDAARTVDGIHFYNSIAVIEKRPQARPGHIKVGIGIDTH